MAELKTKKTEQSVAAFLNGLTDEQKRADSFKILAMMQEISGVKPKMWGPSMIGFGDRHYVYASGHEGDIFRIGFSPRKAAFSLYITCDMRELAALVQKLGKYKSGKGCLYIKKLADIDLGVLREMIEMSWAKQN